jgi:hypothetical protein
MRFQHSFLIAAILGVFAVQASAAGTYSRKTTAAVFMVNPGVNYNVASIAVPAGKWVIHGLSPAVNFDGTSIIRCSLAVDGLEVNSGAAMTGGGSGMPAAIPIANLAVVTTPFTQTIELRCGHDEVIPNQRIDAGAWLVITRAPK